MMKLAGTVTTVKIYINESYNSFMKWCKKTKSI